MLIINSLFSAWYKEMCFRMLYFFERDEREFCMYLSQIKILNINQFICRNIKTFKQNKLLQVITCTYNKWKKYLKNIKNRENR